MATNLTFPSNNPTTVVNNAEGNSISVQGILNGLANTMNSIIGKPLKAISKEINTSLTKGLGGGIAAKTAASLANNAANTITASMETRNKEDRTYKKNLLRGVKNVVSGLLNVSQIYSDATEGIKGELGDAIDKGLGGGLFSKTLKYMSDYISSNIFNAIKWLGNKTANMFKGLADGIKNIAVGLYNMAGSIIKGVGKTFSGFGKWLLGIIPFLGSFLVSGFKGLLGGAGSLLGFLAKPIMGLFSPIASLLTTGLTKAFTGLTSVVGSLFSKMLPFITTALSGYAGYNIGKEVYRMFDPEAVKEFEEASWSNIFKGLGNVIGLVSDEELSKSTDPERYARMQEIKNKKYGAVNSSMDSVLGKTLGVASDLQSLDISRLNTSMLGKSKKGVVGTTIINNVSPVTTSVNNSSASVSIPASLNTHNNEQSFMNFNKSFAY